MPQNNLDILYRRALNENARLTNELNRARQYSALLEEENEKIIIENDKHSLERRKNKQIL